MLHGTDVEGCTSAPAMDAAARSVGGVIQALQLVAAAKGPIASLPTEETTDNNDGRQDRLVDLHASSAPPAPDRPCNGPGFIGARPTSTSHATCPGARRAQSLPLSARGGLGSGQTLGSSSTATPPPPGRGPGSVDGATSAVGGGRLPSATIRSQSPSPSTTSAFPALIPWLTIMPERVHPPSLDANGTTTVPPSAQPRTVPNSRQDRSKRDGGAHDAQEDTGRQHERPVDGVFGHLPLKCQQEDPDQAHVREHHPCGGSRRYHLLVEEQQADEGREPSLFQHYECSY